MRSGPSTLRQSPNRSAVTPPQSEAPDRWLDKNRRPRTDAEPGFRLQNLVRRSTGAAAKLATCHEIGAFGSWPGSDDIYSLDGEPVLPGLGKSHRQSTHRSRLQR